MKWFRFYHETCTDPKLRRVAHQAGATMGHVLAVWVSMLSHASANTGDQRGTLAGWDDVDCAINLGMDKAIVQAIRREMQGRMLADGSVIAWEKRQVESDNTTARWRAWRERSRERNESRSGHRNDSEKIECDSTHYKDIEKQGVSTEPTLAQRLTNATPTLDQRLRGEEKRLEKEDVPSVRRRAVAAPDTRGMRLPVDWQPSDEDRTFAEDMGLAVDTVAAEFRDYWCSVPGTKGRKLNWSATFRNRCREVASRAPRRGTQAQPVSKLAWIFDDKNFEGLP